MMSRGVYERKEQSLVCKQCGQIFIVKQRKGLICRKCQKKEHDKRYRENRRVELAEKQREYQRKNKEKIAAYRKAYIEKNKARIIEKQRQYYEENRAVLLRKGEVYRRKKGMKPNGLSGVEDVVLEFLKEWFLGCEIKTRTRKVVKNPNTGRWLEIDFYLPELNLAIEVHGPLHFYDVYGDGKHEEQKERDKIRREQCLKKGITLIEIPIVSGQHYKSVREKDELRKIVKEHLSVFLHWRDDKNPEDCVWDGKTR